MRSLWWVRMSVVLFLFFPLTTTFYCFSFALWYLVLLSIPCPWFWFKFLWFLTTTTGFVWICLWNRCMELGMRYKELEILDEKPSSLSLNLWVHARSVHGKIWLVEFMCIIQGRISGMIFLALQRWQRRNI